MHHELFYISIYRSFIKKGVLKNFVKFTGKRRYRSLFFNKFQRLSLRTPFRVTVSDLRKMVFTKLFMMEEIKLEFFMKITVSLKRV